MEQFSVIIIAVLFLSFSQHLSADSHSLQYFHTVVTAGINFPQYTMVGLMDGEMFVYYDCNTRNYIPKTEWIKKINADVPDYWKIQTHKVQAHQNDLKVNMADVMERFNHTKGFSGGLDWINAIYNFLYGEKFSQYSLFVRPSMSLQEQINNEYQGVHTGQLMVGCERDEDGKTKGYMQFGYDGADYLSLDLKTHTWTAANAKAVFTKLNMEATGHSVNRWKNYVENVCIDWLKKFVSYGRETLERKVLPEASVFQKVSSSPELVCHATGFFPRGVMMSWQKDGEDLIEDVELRETLPNQDGSFQKRSILKVSPVDLQKHEYTCVIKHSSLKEDLVLKARERRILRDGGSGGVPIGIIVGAVVGLIVLVACAAGIITWKKPFDKEGRRHIFGFTLVPRNPSTPSDTTSSSTSSSS